MSHPLMILCLTLFLFTALTCLFHKKSNRLKARVVIYAYQHHVRLLLPSLWSLATTVYSGRGADIVMQSKL